MDNSRNSAIGILMIILGGAMAVAFFGLPWINLFFVNMSGFDILRTLLEGKASGFETYSLLGIPLFALVACIEGSTLIQKNASPETSSPNAILGIIFSIALLYPYYYIYSDLDSSGLFAGMASSLLQIGYWAALGCHVLIIVLRLSSNWKPQLSSNQVTSSNTLGGLELKDHGGDYDVRLLNVGHNSDRVLGVLCGATDISVEIGKILIRNTPVIVLRGINEQRAQSFSSVLQSAGATTEIIRRNISTSLKETEVTTSNRIPEILESPDKKTTPASHTSSQSTVPTLPSDSNQSLILESRAKQLKATIKRTGKTVTAIGRSESNMTVQLLTEEGTIIWIPTYKLEIEGDITSLEVVQ